MKKLFLFLIVVIGLLIFGTNNIYAQVSITKTARQTLNMGESYKLKISSQEFSDFKIVTAQDGSLTLSLEAFAESTFFVLFNEDGTSFNPTSQEIVSGNYKPGVRNSRFNKGEKIVTCRWNPTVEKFNGSFTFKLDAGRYYLRILRSQTGLSNLNLLLTLKDLEGNEVNPPLFRP